MDSTNNHELVMSIEEIKSQDTGDLFRKAINYVNTDLPQYPETAYEMFKEVIRRDPAYRTNDGDNAYFYMGNIAFYTMAKLDLAYEYYTKAIQVDPEDVYALQNRGFCLLEAARYKEAAIDFQGAVAMDGGKGNLHPEIEKYLQEAKNKAAASNSE